MIMKQDNTIDNIDGIFHCFQCYEKFFILNSKLLLLYQISRTEYVDIINSSDSNRIIEILPPLATKHNLIRKKKQVDKFPSLTLVLTHNCNLNCEYCFDKTSNKGDLDYYHAIESINKFLKTSQKFQLVFFGGEPLLKFELIKQIVDYCEKLKAAKSIEYITYSITTNGKLLTDSILHYLNEYNFSVTISIDGFYSNGNYCVGSAHKSCDIDDLFQYKNIKKLHIRTTVSSENIGYIFSMYNKFSLIEPTCISFMPVIADYEHYTNDHIVLWKKQLELVLYHNIKYKRNIAIDDIFSYVNIVRQHIISPHCQPMKTIMAVDSNGVEYPCHRFIGKKFTNTDYLKSDKSKTICNECDKCWANGICLGTCKYNEMFYLDCQKFNCELIKKRIEIAMYFV